METFGRMWELYECSTSSTETGRKINACSQTYCIDASADGHAQMADHLCYHGAIAEAHDRDGHVHFPL